MNIRVNCDISTENEREREEGDEMTYLQ